MLQYSFVLDTAHPRKDNTCSLKVKIYRSNTDYTFIALKIYVRPEQWDGKKIANSITAATDNARLNNYRVAVGRVLLEIDEKGESPTMMEIRARIERSLGKKKEIPTPFITYFMEATSRVATRKTRQSYESTISKIRKFDATDPSFSAITISWLRNFERFCLDGGMSTNAVGVYMRNIRTVYNRAIRQFSIYGLI